MWHFQSSFAIIVILLSITAGLLSEPSGFEKSLEKRVTNYAPPHTGEYPLTDLTVTQKGKGTKHPGNWNTENCGFKQWPRPAGFWSACMAANNWHGALYCGACVSIKTGSRDPVIAIVSDSCLDCRLDSVDMDLDLWTAVTGSLGDPVLGLVDLEWKIVPCEWGSQPMLLIKREGTNPYYFDVQVARVGGPVVSMEYKRPGSDKWETTTRNDKSNSFNRGSGLGAMATADIRVTCYLSKKVIVTTNVDLSKAGSVEASGNC